MLTAAAAGLELENCYGVRTVVDLAFFPAAQPDRDARALRWHGIQRHSR